jgi:hypothetical protein
MSSVRRKTAMPSTCEALPGRPDAIPTARYLTKTREATAGWGTGVSCEIGSGVATEQANAAERRSSWTQAGHHEVSQASGRGFPPELSVVSSSCERRARILSGSGSVTELPYSWAKMRPRTVTGSPLSAHIPSLN